MCPWPLGKQTTEGFSIWHRIFFLDMLPLPPTYRWMRGTPQGLTPLILWTFPTYFKDLHPVNKNYVLSPRRR